MSRKAHLHGKSRPGKIAMPGSPHQGLKKNRQKKNRSKLRAHPQPPGSVILGSKSLGTKTKHHGGKMRTSRSVANLKVPQKQQQQYEGGTPSTVLREATLVYSLLSYEGRPLSKRSFLSYEGRPLLKRMKNIAGNHPCLHNQSYCGRRLLLLLREATPVAKWT